MRALAPLATLALAASLATAQDAWHGGPASRDAPPPRPPPSAVPAPPAVAFPARPVESDHWRLGRAIAIKFADPEYAAVLADRGRLPSFRAMPEETHIRQARARLAAARKPPADARILSIPGLAAAPVLDGVAHEAEWRGALRIATEPAQNGAYVLLGTHGGSLYLAAHSPPDRTESGYDQFRFFFHHGLSPFLDNERVSVSPGRVSSLRGVRLPWKPEPLPEAPTAESLLQKFDWRVFERIRGAAGLQGYRQFEMGVDLSEAGIARGVAFPANLEIEGDPVLDAAGKFKARFEVGQAGSASAPLWLRIGP